MVQYAVALPSMSPVLARLWKCLMDEESPPLVKAGADGERACALTIRQMLEDPTRCAGFVAINDGESVGFILGYTYARPYGLPASIGQILHWYVEPEFRGRGIGNSLYDRLWGWFSERKVEMVEVMARDEPARDRAWVSRGYVSTLRVYATLVEKQLQEPGKG
ncbi:MAG: GNAT family N-acetyltransferase [Leptospirillum sp.]